MTTEKDGEMLSRDPFDLTDICNAMRNDVTAYKINRLIEADEVGIEARLGDDVVRFLGGVSTGTDDLGALKSNFHSMRGH